MVSPALRRTTGILLLIEGLLLFAPVFILGAAINWPASLDEPASVVLPLLVAQANSVQLGYFIYLIYSLLFLPVAVLVARVIGDQGGVNPMLHVAIGFGIGSAVLRVLGINRWLFAMPLLAQHYVDPAATPETQATIALIYDVLNAYAGQIGELLGVNLFAALWLTLICIEIWRTQRLPRWVAIFGLVTAATLYGALLEVAGVDLGAWITVSVSLVQFWFLALGGYLLLRRTALGQQAAPQLT